VGCCSGTCTDLTTNTNCGACGNACTGGTTCTPTSTGDGDRDDTTYSCK
jgi:hypothetical protein